MHDGPVVCVKFDPLSSRVVASASADGQVIVSTSYLEELDGKADSSGPFGKIKTSEILFKFKCNEWVNTLSFSPSGKQLLFASKFLFVIIAHDSTLHIFPMNEADVASSTKPKDGQKLSYNGAPILTGGFISEDAYVGSGYDKTPILFKRDAGGKWSFVKFLDAGISKQKQNKIGKDAFGGKSVFFDGLKLENDVEMTEKDTKHMNYINCQKKFTGTDTKVALISTSDPNGYIHFWDVSQA